MRSTVPEIADVYTAISAILQSTWPKIKEEFSLFFSFKWYQLSGGWGGVGYVLLLLPPPPSPCHDSTFKGGWCMRVGLEMEEREMP